MILEAQGIRKLYGAYVALDGVSLSIREGEFVSVIGPNGAGKSTLINILLGFLAPTSGVAQVGGMPPRAYVESRGVGYLSELVAIPPMWRVRGALLRYALLARLPASERAARVDAAIAQLGLEEHAGKRVKQLSKGNLQRLGLAQALLSDSDLIILDEPTHGFDPLWTQRFRDIAVGLKRPGRTVIIASHNLDELERVADRVGIIDKGRLQQIAVMGARVTGSLARYRLVVASASPAIAASFPGAEAVTERQAQEYLLPPLDLATLNTGLARIISAGVQVVAVVPERSRLESLFREAVGADQ